MDKTVLYIEKTENRRTFLFFIGQKVKDAQILDIPVSARDGRRNHAARNKSETRGIFTHPSACGKARFFALDNTVFPDERPPDDGAAPGDELLFGRPTAAELAAGRYLITFTNRAPTQAAVGFMLLPAGHSSPA